MQKNRTDAGALLPLRTLVILMSGAAFGAVVALLVYAADGALPAALLAGLGAAGASVVGLDQLIER